MIGGFKLWFEIPESRQDVKQRGLKVVGLSLIMVAQSDHPLFRNEREINYEKTEIEIQRYVGRVERNPSGT
ncbi:MAG: hypothetical protein A2283_15760 [Lentisphaerae bacterium RIFOXYA12_FULL_48_11]|nr:MAG: hypothetical protein A2283_15760 [Lentisphaerae bacterium RIFOXYA12_FULL_48_11]